MNIAFAIIVGVVVWLPTYFLLGTNSALGTAIGGSDLLAVWSPIVLFAAPMFIRASERNSGWAVWILALAPLLMLIGLVEAQIIRHFVFGRVYNPKADLISNVLGSLLWPIASLPLYLSRRRKL